MQIRLDKRKRQAKIWEGYPTFYTSASWRCSSWVVDSDQSVAEPCYTKLSSLS